MIHIDELYLFEERPDEYEIEEMISLGVMGIVTDYINGGYYYV